MSSSSKTEAGIAFESFKNDVYAWAFHVLGSHHDALDMVQEVFLRWIVQAKKEVPEKPRAWLRRTTVNRAIDLARSRKRIDPTSVDDIESPPQSRSQAEDREKSRHVSQALNRLTEMQRLVLTAKEFDDMTFVRIAEELGIAVPTAKTHYLRALQAMRDHLSLIWNSERSE